MWVWITWRIQSKRRLWLSRSGAGRVWDDELLPNLQVVSILLPMDSTLNDKALRHTWVCSWAWVPCARHGVLPPCRGASACAAVNDCSSFRLPDYLGWQVLPSSTLTMRWPRGAALRRPWLVLAPNGLGLQGPALSGHERSQEEVPPLMRASLTFSSSTFPSCSYLCFHHHLKPPLTPPLKFCSYLFFSLIFVWLAAPCHWVSLSLGIPWFTGWV